MSRDLVSYEDSEVESGNESPNSYYNDRRINERRVFIRERSRSPSRGYRRRRSRDHSPRRDYYKDTPDWKTQTPKHTIMVTGLRPHSTETSIRNNILQCGLVPKDIRLLRKRDTGAPRGFAFAEFATVQEAQRWMEMTQGIAWLDDNVKAYLQYSVARDGGPHGFMPIHADGNKNDGFRDKNDWTCSKCFSTSFRRREVCYRCGERREVAEVSLDVLKELSNHPTNTVMLRSLDTLVTEEAVVAKLAGIPEIASLSIKSARIGKDPVTKAHRGICYLEMNNVMDAMKLYQALTSNPLQFEEKQAQVSYCRPISNEAKHEAQSTYASGIQTRMHSAEMMAPEYDPSRNYTSTQIHTFADHSARAYARTPEEYTYYYQYYYQYYNGSTAHQNHQSEVSTSASVAIQQAQALQSASQLTQEPAIKAPHYISNGVHVPPDPNRFQYEESSGFYYDPVTGLYYHSDSQYYYDDQKQEYLYWDAVASKYVTVKENQPEKQEETKAEKKEKDEKLMTAKKIQKDMEKWAKRQRKEAARQSTTATVQAPPTETEIRKQASTADIAFSVIERKEMSSVADVMRVYALKQEEENKKEVPVLSDEEPTFVDPHTDYVKKVCLLCKRQFPTLDVLQKHQQLSSLHKENLEKWIQNNPDYPIGNSAEAQEYRDRAKERRDKFGIDETPQPNRLKEKYMAAMESGAEGPSAPIANDNIGSKLLQKMGWQAGTGLGKTNQGRVDIIEADRRSQSQGLGTKKYGVTGNETYREAVRKVARERFMELHE
ncbi:RNA-binding protein 5-like [Artemia franciscana]|uniref:RNA-binding protein 5 n=1 Tax=Artemia franciscana TaxID=6661 RepID=A0AA88HV99_ARTSF|nr:hypothetical protein QYM36_007158 [Artemia franciscana]